MRVSQVHFVAIIFFFFIIYYTDFKKNYIILRNKSTWGLGLYASRWLDGPNNCDTSFGPVLVVAAPLCHPVAYFISYNLYTLVSIDKTRRKKSKTYSG